jgi:hypothetical protein
LAARGKERSVETIPVGEVALDWKETSSYIWGIKKTAMKTLPAFKMLFLIAGFFFLNLTSAFSQNVSKGVILAGGNAGFNVVRANGNSEVLFTLNPTAGIFIINGLALGANMNLTLADNLTQFGFGPFARYYVAPNIFAQSGFGFSSLKIGNFDANTSLYGNIGMGYSIFLNNHVALEPILNFQFGEAQDVFGVNIGFQVFLGK